MLILDRSAMQIRVPDIRSGTNEPGKCYLGMVTEVV